jgi:hypothetical protein
LLARSGLETNPNHPGLVNNVAFALVESDRAAEAKEALKDADLSVADLTAKICLIATSGLVEYRLNNFSVGRELYLNAIRVAHEEGDRALKGLAQVYMAREEARAGAEGFSELFDRGARELAKHGTPQAVAIANVVQKQIESMYGELLHATALPTNAEKVESSG